MGNGLPKPFHFGLVVTSASSDITVWAAVSTDQILGMTNSLDLGFSACTQDPPLNNLFTLSPNKAIKLS